jgi:hypothetical protein
MKCTSCGRELDQDAADARVASISGSIMGDAYMDTWYLCPACDCYTIDSCHDRFLAEDETKMQGPLSRSEGDRWIAIIRRCDRPWDKKCRCAAHREYFRGCLD